MELSSIGNSYLQENEPWAILKNNPQIASNVLFLKVYLLRLLGSPTEPYMPIFSLSCMSLLISSMIRMHLNS